MEAGIHRLVKKAIKGNKNAFEKLVQHHYKRIYRTAYLYVHNEADALDVVQEATYQAYISINSLRNPEYFTTWLIRIVIRCSAQMIKKRNNVIPMSNEFIANLTEESYSNIEFDYNIGDDDPWLDGRSTAIKKVDNGYYFQWKMKYPYKSFNENFTLPITIHNINGIKGEWNFNIPIQQDKNTTFALNHEQGYPEDGVKIRIKEIITAKASSSLVYETVEKYKDDDFIISKAVDDKGNVYRFGNQTVLQDSEQGDGYHSTVRTEMPKLNSKATSLTFYPQLNIADPKVAQLLDKKSFTLKSKRLNLSLQVNDVTQKGGKLVIDYQFTGLPKTLSKRKLEIINHNLEYNLWLIDKEYVTKIDLENPWPPKNHGIPFNKVEMIDKATARFQSTFYLNGEEKIKNYKLENTILLFDFSSFVSSEDLKPFTVELPVEEE